MDKICLPAAVALIVLPAPVRADADLRQQLSKPVVTVLSSTKSPSEIQLCAADAIGEGFLPLPFPADQAGTIHIFGFRGMMGAGTVQRVVSLFKIPGGTRVDVRTRSGRADPILAASLAACL